MIVVASTDPQLHRLSREVLVDLCREDLLAPPNTRPEAAGVADVCIVDWSDVQSFPALEDSTSKGCRVYLVDRDQIDRFAAVLPPSTVGVLIKPINRAALRLSLEQALHLGQPAEGPSRTVAAGDRDEILQSLLQAYLRLQEHSNDRSAFLARVLHDFRAPLTAINGYCGLFLEGMLGPLRPKQRDAIYRMHRSTTRLSRLAVSLFQLTVNDRVNSETQIVENSIRDTVEQAVHEIRPACEERDISLSFEAEDPEGTLCFDAKQMEQVLVNLLDNASRFTPRHGCISLRGYPYFWERRVRPMAGPIEERRRAQSAAANAYRIDLKDNGPAIAPDILPLIFQEYFSTSSGVDRSNGGLGLAICRLIIRAHGGRIWATSGSEGTVFSFVVPVRPA